MNKRIKRLWLKALRGGKFKQGEGQLCVEEDDRLRHCCLGVLEEIAVQNGVIERYDRYDGALDNTTRKWAGLDSDDPKLGPRKDSRTASWLNDNKHTFAQIADRIEKYL